MRRLFGAFSLAWTAVVRSKLRSLLTVLGILIGVGAVVIVTALGTGVRQRILAQLESMGQNIIFVWPQAVQSSGARIQRGSGARLTEADGRAILREATSIAAVVPHIQTQAQVVSGDHNVLTTVMGTTHPYFSVRAFTFKSGGSFSESDETIKAKVAVLGNTVREHLFGNQDAVGQYIRIGRHAFRVVGVLAPKGQSGAWGEDQDDRILVPIGTYRSRVLPTGPGRVGSLLASATDARTVGRAMAQIEAILRQRHRIAEEREPDFVIHSQAEWLKMQDEVLSTLRTLLVGIALVSLGVGGIGVMNIMLVSVTERTREIGVRMAIGAQAADIRVQFLVEAIVLCLLGGIAGTLFGISGIFALARTLGWSMLLPPEALEAALGTSFAVGIIFGFVPANYAARLDPIEALRHE
jgi:putative ABC transport system permease protein